jgi:hypothetical protein|tara:strand:+ start:318 stop:1256 length:939 start_codon:yes stop_codon:yes gene_type:complete
MIENAQQQAEEEIQIEITDEAEQPEQSKDELDEYSKRVSRRVNKLNARAREAEERAAAAERLAQERAQQLHQYQNLAISHESAALTAEEEKIKAQEAQVDDIFRQAVQSGDAELQSKATTLKNEVAIRKEKLNTAKARREAQAQQQEQYQPYQEQAPQEQQEVPQVEPTKEALAWHETNPWYGDAENEDHKQATQFAYFTHYNLISEGYEPDSEDYYQALDSRVERAYPNLPRQSREAPPEQIEQRESQPAVQRVASAQSSGRSQTRVKKDGVRFSNSELERIRGLKPHNMTEEQWVKTVAKEKQKIQQRAN